MSRLANNNERKAHTYFTMMIGINLVVLVIVVAGMVTGIRGYIADTLFTYHAVTCCGSVCSQCFFTMHTFFTALPWLCIVILFVGISLAVRRMFSMVSWNYRFIRPLIPLPVENHPRLRKILSRVRLDGQLVLFENSTLALRLYIGRLETEDIPVYRSVFVFDNEGTAVRSRSRGVPYKRQGAPEVVYRQDVSRPQFLSSD